MLVQGGPSSYSLRMLECYAKTNVTIVYGGTYLSHPTGPSLADGVTGVLKGYKDKRKLR